MSARSIGSGTIAFGLVSIPVKVYSASQPGTSISFNLLHAKCGGRLKQQYVCPRDGNEVVERDQMVKGYEFAKDRYVTFTPEELKALEEKATQEIAIEEFVPAERVDPIYLDKPYYLGAEKGGTRAYRLLAEAMRETKRTALARYSARGKQYLVQLRPTADNGLVMQTLLYADEVRPFSEVPMEDVQPVREPELKLARQFVEQMSAETFDPGKFHDELRERIQQQVQRKVEGQEIQISEEPKAPTQVIDLMEALRQSLAERKPAKRSPRAEAPAEKAPEKAASGARAKSGRGKKATE